MPIVSVVIPVFSSEKYLMNSVRSILNQTLKDIELIIINTGSSSVIKDIISELGDKRIKTAAVSTAVNPISFLNEGLRISSGKYIALQEPDSISLPTRLEKQLKLLQSDSELILVGCGIKYITDFTNDDIKAYEQFQNSFCKKRETRTLFNKSIFPIALPAIMLEKAVFNGAEQYLRPFEYSLEAFMRNRLEACGEMAKVPEILVYCRHIPGMPWIINLEPVRKNTANK